MISSISIQNYLPFNQNVVHKVNPSSSKLLKYNINAFQTLNSFYPKNNGHKKFVTNILTDLNNDFNNLGISNTNKQLYTPGLFVNKEKRIYSQSKDYSGKNSNKRIINSENVNILNLRKIDLNSNIENDYSCNNINPSGEIVYTDSDYFTPRKKIPKNFKLPQPVCLKYKFSDQNQINYNSNNNTNFCAYKSQFYSNQKIPNGLNYAKNILNNSANNLANLFLNCTDNSAITDDEPQDNSKLTDFTILNELGKGTEGIIYAIRWNKNNKKYAMKKCQILYSINVKKRKDDNKALKDFIDSTGCDGIIKPYATLCQTNDLGYTDCYEIMELADKDWESEILSRGKEKKFYSEFELMEIFRYLIKTFALLQAHHITHRDIKPQNIMVSQGKLKICDFGNARVLKRNGIIIQRIRGSELFMSPIVFKGYRSGIQNIRHNAYKSDVYSLGICFFLAASLCYDGPNVIRQMLDMNKIKKVLDYNLKNKYSENMINMILTMLQVEESKRPDFLELEALIS